jgi:hypothetical protein
MAFIDFEFHIGQAIRDLKSIFANFKFQNAGLRFGLTGRCAQGGSVARRYGCSPEGEEELAELYRYIEENATADVALRYTTAAVEYCEGLAT